MVNKGKSNKRCNQKPKVEKTDNTKAQIKKDRQTTLDKTLHKKLKIELKKSHKKHG